MTSIRLHHEFGVNPTISQCFWCGESKNEIALLGAAYKGRAPMYMITNHEPCDKCKEQWRAGILLVEVDRSNPTRSRPEIAPGISPTGRWCVLREEAVTRLISEGCKWLGPVLEHRRGYIEKQAYEMFLPEEAQAEKKNDAG